jgi:hypothetical protein
MVEDIAERDDVLDAARIFVENLLPHAVAAYARECRRSGGTHIQVPPDVRTRLLDGPPGLIPALVEIVRSPQHPLGDSYMARAVDLLAVLEARVALPAIFELCVRDGDDHDVVVHHALACAIRDLDALDEVLGFGRSRDSYLGGLPFIVVFPELYCEKILAWLVDMLPRDTPNVAIGFQCTSDIRAIPHLRRQLGELDPSRCDWTDCVAGLTGAIQYLHQTLKPGEQALTPDEQALHDRAIEERHRRAQERARASVPEARPDPYREATDLATSPERLAALSEHMNRNVRSAVALHPAAPARVLARLARDIDPDVRWCAGRNESLPLELVEQLARDPHVEARESIAGNPSLPEHLRDLLWRDADGHVRAIVLRHLPDSALADAARDPDPRVRAALSLREDLPLEVIEQLAEDVDAEVRLRLLDAVRPPGHVIRRLLEDKDERVRRAAAEQLRSGTGLRLVESHPAPGADDP